MNLLNQREARCGGKFYLYLRPPFARYSFNYLETLQRLIAIGNNNKLNAVFFSKRNYASIENSDVRHLELKNKKGRKTFGSCPINVINRYLREGTGICKMHATHRTQPCNINIHVR